MNKRCTNSACRSTFSTLNFDGKCPFCGKAYLQIKCGRKQKTTSRQKQKPNGILIFRKNGYYRLKLDLGEVRRLIMQDELIKSVRMLRDTLQKAGYRAESVRDLRDYVMAIKSREEGKAVWRLLTEKDGFPQKAKVLRMRIE